jgi:hypothetical protein
VRKTELVVLDSSNMMIDLELDSENREDEVDALGNPVTALTFQSVPTGASLYIDDVLVSSNPYVAKYPRDGAEHVLRATAQGYSPKTQTVTFDKPRDSVTLKLDREPATALTPPVPVHHPAPVRTSATPKGVAVAKPPAARASAQAPQEPAGVKKLDRSDPWRN